MTLLGLYTITEETGEIDLNGEMELDSALEPEPLYNLLHKIIFIYFYALFI